MRKTLTESPSALLRRAAALMRQRAEAAKELTGDGHGDWHPWGSIQETEYRKHPEPVQVPVPFASNGDTMTEEGTHVPTGEAFVAHARWAHDDEMAWHEAEFIAGPMPEPVAAHIALLHPGVALAVADWLDSTAGFIAARSTVTADSGMHGLPQALAVARACLKEDATGNEES